MNSDISTRKDMADKLESVMNKAYVSLKDEMHLKRNTSLVKSYLLEAHTITSKDRSNLPETLSQYFSTRSGNRSGVSVSAHATKDDSLIIVSGTSRNGQFTFYVDITDQRFWIAHTIAKSEISDHTLEAVLKENPNLDCMWMPMELLEYVLKLGASRGLGLDFDRRYLGAPLLKKKRNILSLSQNGAEALETPLSNSSHLDYVKMQLWGTGADRILTALKEAKLSHSTTISKVRLRTEDNNDEQQFSLADVKFDGKITGRGTSFAVYNALLVNVLKHYSTAVRRAEERFRLHWEADQGRIKANGQPFYIKLGEDGIANLDLFCARLFSGAEPFLLMGLPIRRNTNFYTASAIDLHVNQRVDFEISRTTISVFLPNKACGNTLLRLYTNLQHYFSSDVKAIDGSGSEVFSFQS